MLNFWYICYRRSIHLKYQVQFPFHKMLCVRVCEWNYVCIYVCMYMWGGICTYVNVGGWVGVYVLAPHKLAVVHVCNPSIPEKETAAS